MSHKINEDTTAIRVAADDPDGSRRNCSGPFDFSLNVELPSRNRPQLPVYPLPPSLAALLERATRAENHEEIVGDVAPVTAAPREPASAPSPEPARPPRAVFRRRTGEADRPR